MSKNYLLTSFRNIKKQNLTAHGIYFWYCSGNGRLHGYLSNGPSCRNESGTVT